MLGGGDDDKETDYCTAKSVVNLGWKPEDHYPLKMCEGDCDSDDHCGPGLYCFQRDTGRIPVPGCLGGEDDKEQTDYCTAKSVVNLGWKPEDHYPLEMCKGDCDSDDHCGPGLYCFQRHAGGDPVPGCLGGEDDQSTADYCVLRSITEAPTAAPIEYKKIYDPDAGSGFGCNWCGNDDDW